jgi:hypothetical protein
MSGIAYELVPEAEAPDDLQPGVTRYIEQPDGGVEEYIGDEDGNPVLVSGRSQVLFAADLHVYESSSNSRNVYCDALGLSNVRFESGDDYDSCQIDFNNAPPNPAKAKVQLRNLPLENGKRDFSVQHSHSTTWGESSLSITAYEEGADHSLILRPGEFHVYVEVLQF